MARMLGCQRHAGCGNGRCRHCGDGNETRAFKRLEARRVAAEILEHTGREIPDLFADPSDCRHGCNGSPCGSERCTFTCHPAG